MYTHNTWIVVKNVPWTGVLKSLQQWAIDTGLFLQSMNKAKAKVFDWDYCYKGDKQYKAFKLNNVLFPFYFLCTGLSLAGIVFVIEWNSYRFID